MSIVSAQPTGSPGSRVSNAQAAGDDACRCGLDHAPDTRPDQATPDAGADRRVRLTRLKLGQIGSVCGGRLDDDDRDMLRALGLRPDARIRLARAGEPCIVQVLGPHGCSCRIGLARPLAERVIVRLDDSDTGR